MGKLIALSTGYRFTRWIALSDPAFEQPRPELTATLNNKRHHAFKLIPNRQLDVLLQRVSSDHTTAKIKLKYFETVSHDEGNSLEGLPDLIFLSPIALCLVKSRSGEGRVTQVSCNFLPSAE